mmetsp:Transcript_2152/g.4893  ORF Transcript_2152/g.4893 Transcript_2152/m.4893 type:complete len:303 (+) Transcript_2152:268-1176(+)|eukprot:CAMPEP_0171093916 /NCGR_PEP_ID=MMETSP0766_2-20121228/39353_1 /TAXON_ID=439317 /ORGANISM="Gambierdiscus australes, Strain CAWD 149" /LENGTH=302 /DNA_ID=CAMNT_0011552427 /DNA_START=264 /DNA_END=1172 /DNA_ORIENTATION=+
MAVQALNNDAEVLFRFCAENAQGVTDDELAAAGWTDKTQLLQLANQLLGQQRLSLLQLASGRLLYKATDPRLVGLDHQHMLVYQLIEKAGNKGTWSRVLKDESKLQQHLVTKITKDLMGRRLIKEVKSITAKNKKVFMLWDTEPAQEVSGGTWYHEGEFAAAWVESLRQQCQQFMESNNGKAVTLQDVHAHLLQKPGPSVPTEEDTAQVMRTLALDEDVYSVQTATGQMVYTQRNRAFDIFAGRIPNLFAQSELPGLVVPCLSCPVQAECHSGGRICPEKCEYLAAWVRGSGGQAQGQTNDW